MPLKMNFIASICKLRQQWQVRIGYDVYGRREVQAMIRSWVHKVPKMFHQWRRFPLGARQTWLVGAPIDQSNCSKLHRNFEVVPSRDSNSRLMSKPKLPQFYDFLSENIMAGKEKKEKKTKNAQGPPQLEVLEAVKVSKNNLCWENYIFSSSKSSYCFV